MRKDKRNSRLLKFLSLWLTLALLTVGMPVGAYAAEASGAGAGIEKEAVVEDAALAEGEEGEEGQNTPSENETQKPVEPAPAPAEVQAIEVNQGMSKHTGLNGGEETQIKQFVAGKQTVVMMKIPGSDSFTQEQAESAKGGYKLEVKSVTNGQEADSCEMTADGSSLSVKQAYDIESNPEKGWYVIANFEKGPDKGTYNFHMKNGDQEIGKLEGITFFETKKLNILVLPVNGYWSASYNPDAENGGGAPSAGAFSVKNMQFKDRDGSKKNWDQLCASLKSYLLDVYPVADANFDEGELIEAGTDQYDMVAEGNGQLNLWQEACKRQSKGKDGKDKYDLILAFVAYRQDKGTGQGYTMGKPANIITYTDVDMLPTVVHEIAHCYQVGDEYNGGSFNNKVNFPPNNYKGRDFVTGADIASTSGASEYWKAPAEYSGSKNVDKTGAGTMVNLTLHPFSLANQSFIKWGGVNDDGSLSGSEAGPTITYMGSGYTGCEGYYWTSSVIWDHLLKQFATKSKKEAADNAGGQTASAEDAVTNAAVFANALESGGADDENAFLDEEDDFYYDDDYRFGETRMIEVNGWLRKNKSGLAEVDYVSPMFSYDGDLETIEPIDENLKNDTANIYSFVALDDEKKVQLSVDGKPAAVPFYASFYNPSMPSTKKDQDRVNFNFDADYPTGTADFVIIKGKVGEDNSYSEENVIWRATADGVKTKKNPVAVSENTFRDNPDGYLVYADVNAESANLEWEVYLNDQADEPYDNADGKLYTEVYYCPDGDDGEAFYVGCSDDEDAFGESIRKGNISFKTNSRFEKTPWTKNAYVWVKVTNGVNGVDIYSDDNDITLSNSVIELSGAGIKKDRSNYYTECTGSEIRPTVKVKAKDPETGKYNISLKKDVDYTVTYKDNVNVGFATVEVQGIGSYAGKNTAEFEITKKALNATPASIPDMVYSASLDKDVQKYLRMTDAKAGELVYDKDFTVDFSGKKTLNELFPEAPQAATAVTVTYQGKGNYTGSSNTTVKFDVLPSGSDAAVLSNDNTKVVLKKTKMSYTGKAIKPAIKSVTVTVSGQSVALKSSEYKVVYSNNVAVGTMRVTVVGKKKYTGSAYATCEIAPKEVTSLSVTGLKDQPYSGNPVDVSKLPIVVKAGGITLTKDVDYVISANKADPSLYTKVTAKGAEKPSVLITLKESNGSGKQPKVTWKKGKEKVVKKNFSIVKTKLNSSAVTFSVSSSSISDNVVRSADKSKEIGYIRGITKAEQAEARGKYSYVIVGSGDGAALEKNADISGATLLKAFGVNIDPSEYDVTVSQTKADKIGSITYKAKSSSAAFSGKKVIKFLYLNSIKAN